MSSYVPTSGAASPTSGPPPTTAHKIIGTLNIVFGSAILLCGLCSGVYTASLVAAAPMMKNAQQQINTQQQKQRDQRIEALEKRVKDAKTDEERVELKAQRKAIENEPQAPDFGEMFAWVNDIRIVGFMWADLLSSLLVNVPMLVSGVGLLGSREWARKTGLWVAGLKLVRLVALYGFAIVVVVPVYAEKMGEMVVKMQPQMPPGQGGPNLQQMGPQISMMYATMMTGGAVLMIIAGSVYPIISLWVLSRGYVKAACGQRETNPMQLP